MLSPAKVDSSVEEDRLTLWRNERYHRGLLDKEDRIKAKDIEKQSQTDLEALEKEQAARALLPTKRDLEDQERAILMRRKRSALQASGLFIGCVILPLLVGLYYFFAVATPLYEARTVIAVSKGDVQESVQQAGLLNSLTQAPNLQPIFMADAYISSQAMMAELENRQSAITRWSSEEIDPILRLRTVPVLGLSKERQIGRFVQSSVDIQTGLLTISVRDPDQLKAEQAAALIIMAIDSRMNGLKNRQFDVQIAQAEASIETARGDLLAAQQQLLALQLQSGEVDPSQRIESIYATLQHLEAEALELEGEAQRAEIAGRGDTLLAGQTRQLVNFTRSEIENRRALLVEGTVDAPSLNKVLLEYDMANLRIRASEKALEIAFDNLAAVSRQAANSQSSLQVIVPPQSSAVPLNTNGVPTLLLIGVVSLSLFAFLRILQFGRDPEFG